MPSKLTKGLPIIVLSALASAQSPAADPARARVEGRVVSATGDPVKKATVRLLVMANPTPASGDTIMNYTSTSDGDGNSVFEDIQPQRYQILVERREFVRTTYGAKSIGAPGTPIQLSAGQKLTEIVVKMLPQALIAGKITDEDGDAFGTAKVEVHRFVWTEGRRQFVAVASADSLADGTFMIGDLPAGRYYLSASDPRVDVSRFPHERPGRRGPPEEFVTTYYPNAIEVAAAAPIELTAGIDVRGIELRMRRTRVFRVSGRAMHTGGQSLMNLVLTTTRPGDQNLPDMGSRTAIRDGDGRFEFANLAPGQYIIHTQPNQAVRGEPMVGRVVVNVTNEDVENVVLTLGPGAEIAGQLILEGVGPLNVETRKKLPSAAGAPPATAQAVLELTVAEGRITGVPGGAVQDDGTFQFKHVQSDKFRMALHGVPAGCYVKSVRFADQDVTHSLLDLTGGIGGKLEIVISTNAAEIDGVVRNEKGEAVPSITLVVWNTSVEFSMSPDMRRRFRSDKTGAFKLDGLAPGDYRIVAWEEIDPLLALDEDFRKKFESRAAAVKVGEKATETVEVKLIPAATIDAEAAKIR